MSDWIATRWETRESLDAHALSAVSIGLMVSPFYEGVRFAVRRAGRCLNMDGEWEWEPTPSSRDDAFYARCRFGSFDAARLAAEGKDGAE